MGRTPAKGAASVSACSILWFSASPRSECPASDRQLPHLRLALRHTRSDAERLDLHPQPRDTAWLAAGGRNVPCHDDVRLQGKHFLHCPAGDREAPCRREVHRCRRRIVAVMRDRQQLRRCGHFGEDRIAAGLSETMVGCSVGWRGALTLHPIVIPAKAGTQSSVMAQLTPALRGDDEEAAEFKTAPLPRYRPRAPWRAVSAAIVRAADARPR